MYRPPTGYPDWYRVLPESYCHSYPTFPPPSQCVAPQTENPRLSGAPSFGDPLYPYYPDNWEIARRPSSTYIPYSSPYRSTNYPAGIEPYSSQYSPWSTQGEHRAYNYRSEHRNYAPQYPQDHRIDSIGRSDYETVFEYEASDEVSLPPRRGPSLPSEPRDNRHPIASQFLQEIDSNSEESVDSSSNRTISQPSLLADERLCELCEQDDHTADCCRLANWDEPNPQPAPRNAAQEQATLSEDHEKYQKLAGKLSHICWNLIPDSEQPPESHKSMMRHILQLLSSHPDNPEIVYNHMFGNRFDGEWLCLKAMCDTEWKGPMWLVNGACLYCRNPARPDPVTLCYQVMSNRGRMAIYREVGTVRAGNGGRNGTNA